ncbi:MAG: ABC transporter substrate-binding protein [Spirochaetia bacterium]
MRLISFLLALFILSCAQNSRNATMGYTRVVAHVMGETTISESPQRVVALTGEATEALLALGITPIAAVASYTPDMSWYPHIMKAMRGVEIIGDERQVDLEKIATLKPDLIIGIKARQENIYPILSQIAPTVFKENFYGEWKKNFYTVAQAVNREGQANQVMQNWDNQIATLSKALKKAGILDKTTAIYRFSPKSVRYYGNAGFAASIIKELGFNRPANHDTQEFNYEVSQELIPDMNAQQAFYFIFSSDNSSAAYENLGKYMDSLLFRSLDHRGIELYEVDSNTWNKSYGILAGHEVLKEIQAIFLSETQAQAP